VSLRASQSRDIRAPNFRELYYGQVIPEGSLFGYCDNPWTGNRFLGFFTFTGDTCVLDLHGGLEIKPEEADTTTIGFVLTPPDLSVRFAADYYRIDITDSIQAASVPLTIEACFNGVAVECARIQGDLINPSNPVGGFSKINVVSAVGFNAAGYDVRGIDLTADWIGDFDFGTVSSRLIASRMLQQLVSPSVAAPGLQRDVAGVVGSTNGFLADFNATPDWTAQWINTFVRGPVTLTTQTRWVKEGDIYADRFGPNDSNFNPNAANSIDDNSLPDYFVWSLSGSYDFTVKGTDMNVFGTIENLFDKEPPLSGTGTGGASATFYDTIGRNFRVGVRASF
jgi:iron complex outermembrane receptor protein